MLKEKVESVLSVAVALSAITLAAVAVYRLVLVDPPVANQVATYEEDWSTLLPRGKQLGAQSAKVHPVVFADYQCPFCRSFHEDAAQLRREFPGMLAVTHIDFPLPTHPFAADAASIADCAETVGQFSAVDSMLYANQAILGQTEWLSMLSEAHIPRSEEIVDCHQRNDPSRSAESAREFARSRGVRVTPTVLVNGWRYTAPPHRGSISRAIRDLLRNREPFPR